MSPCVWWSRNPHMLLCPCATHSASAWVHVCVCAASATTATSSIEIVLLLLLLCFTAFDAVYMDVWTFHSSVQFGKWKIPHIIIWIHEMAGVRSVVSAAAAAAALECVYKKCIDCFTVLDHIIGNDTNSGIIAPVLLLVWERITLFGKSNRTASITSQWYGVYAVCWTFMSFISSISFRLFLLLGRQRSPDAAAHSSHKTTKCTQIYFIRQGSRIMSIAIAFQVCRPREWMEAGMQYTLHSVLCSS